MSRTYSKIINELMLLFDDLEDLIEELKEKETEMQRAGILIDRATRPYDAMGDDQGRGETADEWYCENFIESDAYKEEEDE